MTAEPKTNCIHCGLSILVAILVRNDFEAVPALVFEPVLFVPLVFGELVEFFLYTTACTPFGGHFLFEFP